MKFSTSLLALAAAVGTLSHPVQDNVIDLDRRGPEHAPMSPEDSTFLLYAEYHFRERYSAVSIYWEGYQDWLQDYVQLAQVPGMPTSIPNQFQQLNKDAEGITSKVESLTELVKTMYGMDKNGQEWKDLLKPRLNAGEEIQAQVQDFYEQFVIFAWQIKQVAERPNDLTEPSAELAMQLNKGVKNAKKFSQRLSDIAYEARGMVMFARHSVSTVFGSLH